MFDSALEKVFKGIQLLDLVVAGSSVSNSSSGFFDYGLLAPSWMLISDGIDADSYDDAAHVDCEVDLLFRGHLPKLQDEDRFLLSGFWASLTAFPKLSCGR